MAHESLIDGTAYEVAGGRTLVGGTGYDVVKGKTLVGGTGYDVEFSPVLLSVSGKYRETLCYFSIDGTPVPGGYSTYSINMEVSRKRTISVTVGYEGSAYQFCEILFNGTRVKIYGTYEFDIESYATVDIVFSSFASAGYPAYRCAITTTLKEE